MTDRDKARQRRSRRMLAGLIGLISILFAGWAFQAWRSTSDALAAAKDDLDRCQEMIAEIERLRHKPRVAALAQETTSAMTRRVSRSMKTASLPTTALQRVEPQQPVRVNRTPYLLRSTRIELSDISLKQIVRFADALGDAEQGLIVRNLTLTEPPSPATGSPERWTAEVTLTQSIYSPMTR